VNSGAKFGIAALAVAVLLLNPINACAKLSVLSMPAHPCCPEKQAPPAETHALDCTCLFTEQSPVTVPANDAPGVPIEPPATASPGLALVAFSERPTFSPILPGLQDSYLSIHQLLL